MNVMSKEELRAALQQITSAVSSQKTSQEHIKGVISSLAPKVCSRQDIQSVIKEANLDKLSELVKEQQAAFQQLSQQMLVIERRFTDLEIRLDSALSSVQTIQSETEMLMGLNHLRYPRQNFNNSY